MNPEEQQTKMRPWWQTPALLVVSAVLAVVGASVAAAAAFDTTAGEKAPDSAAVSQQTELLTSFEPSLPALPTAPVVTVSPLPNIPAPSRPPWSCAEAEAKVKAVLKEQGLAGVAQAKVTCTGEKLTVTVAVAADPVKVHVIVEVHARGTATICTNGNCHEYPSNGKVFSRDGHVVLGNAGGAIVNVRTEIDLSALPVDVGAIVSAQTLHGIAIKIGAGLG